MPRRGELRSEDDPSTKPSEGFARGTFSFGNFRMPFHFIELSGKFAELVGV